MKATIIAVAAILAVTPVSAQQQVPSQQSPIVVQLKSQLGELLFNNASLAGQVQDLAGQNAVLNAKVKDLEAKVKDLEAKTTPKADEKEAAPVDRR
jgi:hypothetical protein